MWYYLAVPHGTTRIRFTVEQRLLAALLFVLLFGVSACGPRAAAPPATFTLPSRLLGETRRINIYTPPGYGRGRDRYPVLYMPDGGLGEDFPHVTRTADAAIRAGEMRPLVIVGIENTERRRDLTGPTEVEDDRKIAPRVGGSARFRAFLVEELRPEIERRVRGDGQTGIIGESLAGLFVIETLLLQPDAFDVYIALSPSLWWNGEALVRGAGERLGAVGTRPKTFYLGIASDDGNEAAAGLLTDALRRAAPPSLSWSFAPWPQATHATIYRVASPAVLREVYRP